MANLGKLFATLNQTYADSGIAHVSQIVRDLVLAARTSATYLVQPTYRHLK